MFWICGVLDEVLFNACRIESESENIINLSCELQLSTKSKTKSIDFASAVKTEEPSGMRIVWWSFALKTAQPTLS